MKIVCKLKREGGSKVELGDTTYHFKPNAAGDHVADVDDEQHAQQLLAVTEGYEAYGDDAEPDTQLQDGQPAEQARRGRKPRSAQQGEEP